MFCSWLCPVADQATGSGTEQSVRPTELLRTVQTGNQVGNQNQRTDHDHDDASGFKEVFLRPAHRDASHFNSHILSILVLEKGATSIRPYQVKVGALLLRICRCHTAWKPALCPDFRFGCGTFARPISRHALICAGSACGTPPEQVTPVGEKETEPFQFTFNGFLKVAFQGSRVTSDAGLILVRELDERLGLEAIITAHLTKIPFPTP